MSQSQICPMHADEFVVGVLVNHEGAYSFTCERTSGHVVPGPFTWMQAPEPPDMSGISGLAEELRLDIELPAAINAYPGRWLEYGVVEALYADANPTDFALLVDRYSHTAIHPTKYSASAFLASTLGHLSRTGHVHFHAGPATGRWSYNSGISWWALDPETDWADRLSWADLGRSMDYVPGSTE